MRRYDLTAGMYDSRYAEEQDDKYHAVLANVTPRGLVLDVGCGTGLLFNHVSPKTASLIGVDVSKGLLIKARERAKTLGNVNLIQVDADHLPFRDGEFSAVFAFTLLQNMPKPLKTLREVRRTAQDDAVIAVTGLKKTFSTETLVDLLRNAGLHVVSVEDDEKLKCHVALSLKRA
jgi:ubiquinone/menaquinone biosynthesis C-methylase UbiE